ncbi:MAG: PQQ-binding-like beta-propeller repeat protein [Planctomycetales bacterium]
MPSPEVAARLTIAVAIGFAANSLMADEVEFLRSANLDAAARAICDAAGVRGGVCVQVGCGDGGLTAALGRGGAFLVHGLAGDAREESQARETLRARGGYGSVSAERAAPGKLPYADDLVNLLIVQDFPAQAAAGLELDEVLRVLTPRGVAMLGAGTENADELKAKLRKAGPGDIELVETPAGVWAKIVKPRPPGMDDWSHARHDPSRRATSRDDLVGPTRSLRWIDGPGRARGHTGRPIAAVSAGGRFFHILDEATPFLAVPAEAHLVARDAFNGTVLWKRPVRTGDRNSHSPNATTLVADDERVYAVLDSDGPLHVLDAATGETIDVYLDTQPDGVIVLDEGILLQERGDVRLIDAKTGTAKWSVTAGRHKNEFAAAGGRVFVNVTRLGEIQCFDLADGKPLWKASEKEFIRTLSLCGVIDDTLVMATRERLIGFSAADGARKWTRAYAASGRGHPINTFFSRGLVWAHDVGNKDANRPDVWIGLDPRDGGLKQSFPAGFQDKCALGMATENYLITGRAHFFQCATGEVDFPHVARGACGFGTLPANGLLYTFPTDCQCYPMLYGITAMSPEPVPHDGGTKGELERGPAAGETTEADRAVDLKDWPCYRHDSRRSGGTTTLVPPSVRPSWTADVAPGERITPPVVAGGRVFVAAVDAQQVCAFDAATGRELWRFIAGGRIPFPPTIFEGRCLFGSEDGWVYSLDAESGTLAWRFRAAPGTRRIVAYGRLASPWPVLGSVTIVDGAAYALAGRHGPLDGGLRIVALEPDSGSLIWDSFPKEATRADLLVEGTEHLFLWDACIEPKTGLYRGRGHRIVEGALRARASFLTDVWSNRTAWEKGGAEGQLLVFRGSGVAEDAKDDIYGVRAFSDADKYTATRPAKGDYRLFARRGEQAADTWSLAVAVRARSLVLTGETLFAAGPPDSLQPTGGVLLAVDAASGAKRAELELEQPPVLDGLIAARGRLYLSTVDGRLSCLGGR